MKSIEEARAQHQKTVHDAQMRRAEEQRLAEELAAVESHIEREIYQAGVVQQVRNATNFLDIPTKPFKCLVHRMIPEGQLGFIIGTSAGGKTTITTQIAAAAANGVPAFGSRATIKRPVIILDNENTVGGIQRLWRRVNDDLSASDVFWWGRWKSYRHPVPSKLDDRFLVTLAESYDEPPLIICDSFVTFLGDGDENSSRDCAAVLDRARVLTDTGCSVLFIHHFGKDKPNKKEMKDIHGGRGSSAIGGAIDYLYNFDSRVVDNRLLSGHLYCAKSRDSEYQDSDIVFDVPNQGPKARLVEITENPAVAAKNAESIKLLTQLEEIVTKEGANGITQNEFMKVAVSVVGATQPQARAWWKGREAVGNLVIKRAGTHRTATQTGVWKTFVSEIPTNEDETNE